jgi:hypothetical protein
VGLISYPLYLWHWLLLSFANIVLSENIDVSIPLGIIIVSLLLAWMTYLFIELPIRKSSRGFFTILSLCCGMAATALFGIIIYLENGIPSRLSADALAAIQDVTNHPAFENMANCPAALQGTALNTGYCRSSRPLAATAAVWGDSHASRFFDGITSVDTSSSWLLLGASSCPPVLGIEVLDDRSNCAAVNEVVANYLRSTPAVDIVVLVFFGNYLASDDYAADHVGTSVGPSKVTIKVDGERILDKANGFAIGLEGTVDFLESIGKRIIIVVDNPELPFFPKQCVPRPFVGVQRCSISIQDVKRRQHSFRDVIHTISQRHRDLVVFDPLDVFCDNQKCTPERNGVILYFDSHHLSLRGSKLVAEKFMSEVFPGRSAELRGPPKPRVDSGGFGTTKNASAFP